MPTVEFMQHCAQIRRRDRHRLLIIDEIQAGFGRTGKWSSTSTTASSDIITVAKGITSGYPLGAIVAPKALWDKSLPGSMAAPTAATPWPARPASPPSRP